MAIRELLDAEGHAVDGVYSFYVIPGNIILFSEDVEEREDCYVFTLDSTAIIKVVMNGNTPGVMAIPAKGHVELMLGNKIIVPIAACARINSLSAELYANCRKVCSHIIQPGLKRVR